MLKERGIGILLITHHISFARKATDQVLFLADGKIAEHGPAASTACTGSGNTRNRVRSRYVHWSHSLRLLCFSADYL